MSTSPLKHLSPEYRDIIDKLSKKEKIKAGKFVFREGGKADEFYLIEEGRVAIELHVPHRGPVVFETLDKGDILGLSWIEPPHRWHFDALAVSDLRLTAIDAKKLLGHVEKDPVLGYEIMKIFAPVILKRLQAARLKLSDLYANPDKVKK